MMELVPLALESAAFVSLLSLNSISADILILSHLNKAYFVMVVYIIAVMLEGEKLGGPVVNGGHNLPSPGSGIIV